MVTSMIILDHSRELSIADAIRVVKGESVALEPTTRALLSERREQIMKALSQSAEPAYGFNRGFGHNVDQAVPSDELALLQRNFLRSHACGVGPAAPREVVRATMLLRAQSLARGYSAVRPEVIEALLAFLNHDLTPVVPSFGSVGASGDLAPLSHIGLALIGEGEVFVAGKTQPIPSLQAIEQKGIPILSLEMKEGLALSNGVQFSTACGVIACDALRTLLKTEVLSTALTAQVMLSSDAPFKPELHDLRPHRGSKIVADWIWSAMQDSPIRDAHRDYAIDAEIQDPYNLRCAAQILGACYDLIEDAAATFTTEINSATDNPLLLPSEDGSYTTVISGGHFHGMPVAVKLYNVVQAIAIIGSLVNARCSRYIDGARNKGLGNDLVWPSLDERARAISSSMMIPEYVSAALSNALIGLSTPSHLFSISTNAGQEDHVSMSAALGVRLLDMVPRLSELVAIELAYASQAAAIRKHTKVIPSKHHPEAQRNVNRAVRKLEVLVRKRVDIPNIAPKVEIHLGVEIPQASTTLSPVSEAVLARVWETFPPVMEDRVLSYQIQKLAELAVSGALVRAAEAVLPFREPLA